MPEAKDDLKREKVRIVPISNIEDFPDHPFQVKDDESMDQLVESIRMNGVLNPVIALKIDENHYQLISGHRRKRACMLLGIDRIPLIGREMTKEEAVIEMVDSNLQREHILPSEKAKAYSCKTVLPNDERLLVVFFVIIQINWNLSTSYKKFSCNARASACRCLRGDHDG